MMAEQKKLDASRPAFFVLFVRMRYFDMASINSFIVMLPSLSASA